MSKAIVYWLAAIFATANATAQSNSPRELAMGGTAVASADSLSAGFSNPALLTNYKGVGEKFSLLVPNLSIFISDRNNLIDAMDDFNQAFDNLDAGLSSGSTTLSDLENLSASLNGLNDKHFNIGVNTGLSLVIPSAGFGLAVVVRSAIEADGFMNVDAADLGLIIGADGSPSIGAIGSAAVLLGSFRNEIGIAIAKEFEIANRNVSFGITPKIQSFEILNVVVAADNSSNFESQINSENRVTEDGLNIDFGASMMLNDEIRVGLSARNLISKTVAGLSGLYTYELSPALTTGIAYTNGPLTFAADLDLNTTPRFQEVAADDSQFLRLGAETQREWLQLRAGYIVDLKDNYANMATAGLGFSPFGTIHFDLAGAVGENSYAGAFALSFTF
ncbi:MAG: hypothetical protein ACI84O_000980 [Myxococcota bacterium]|jgi:hypothetical protein